MPIAPISPPPVPPKPWASYSWPKLARTVTITKFSPKALATPIVGAIGVLVPLVVAIMKLRKSSPLSHPTPGVAKPESSSGRRPFDPYTDHDFWIVIDGIEAGAFQKFDGLSWDCDVIEYKDSMDPWPRKRPGIHRFVNIKLTKGMITNTALYDWCAKVQSGEMDRRNGAIHVLDRTGDKNKPVLTYEFFQAWPTKWSSFRADGKGGATLLEEIELAVDSFNLKKK